MDKTIADKSPNMLLKITPYVDDNQWLKPQDTELIKPTNQNYIKVPKVVKLTNAKMTS